MVLFQGETFLDITFENKHLRAPGSLYVISVMNHSARAVLLVARQSFIFALFATSNLIGTGHHTQGKTYVLGKVRRLVRGNTPGFLNKSLCPHQI